MAAALDGGPWRCAQFRHSRDNGNPERKGRLASRPYIRVVNASGLGQPVWNAMNEMNGIGREKSANDVVPAGHSILQDFATQH
jgi:hypothetical protein